jgi:FkbM family methyltransferase
VMKIKKDVKKAIYSLGKSVLTPFPDVKVFLKGCYRRFRTNWLRMVYPKGAFMSCNGAQVFCDFSSENYSWYDGDSDYMKYELEVFTSLFKERAPDIVLDVGAHWGFYPAFLSNSVYAEIISKLILIEADPANHHILSKTLSSIKSLPVVQINAAISEKDGSVDLYSGGDTCIQTYCSSNAISIGHVQAVCLDSVAKNYLKTGEAITHVKIDIDGYEPAFFAGGLRTLKKYNPIIMMEFWAKGLMVSGYDLAEYWNMLQENYYVKEACFPDLPLVPLKHEDLAYLVNKTMDGITNLVLVPKTTEAEVKS